MVLVPLYTLDFFRDTNLPLQVSLPDVLPEIVAVALLSEEIFIKISKAPRVVSRLKVTVKDIFFVSLLIL